MFKKNKHGIHCDYHIKWNGGERKERRKKERETQIGNKGAR